MILSMYYGYQDGYQDTHQHALCATYTCIVHLTIVIIEGFCGKGD